MKAKMITRSNTAALVIPMLVLAAWGTQLRAAQAPGGSQLRATQLRGKYSSKPPTENVSLALGSNPFEIEFMSGNKAQYRDPARGQNMEVSYEVRGRQVMIKYPQGTVVATIGDDGCLDGGALGLYGKLCKETYPEGTATPTSTTPTSYLEEMPDPARVVADVVGSDSLDTAARQRAALDRLEDVITSFATERGCRVNPPPDCPEGMSNAITREEQEFNGRYSRASGAILEAVYHALDPNNQQNFGDAPNSPRQQWNRVYDSYNRMSYIQALLRRYLSPRTRAHYLEVLRARALESAQLEQANVPRRRDTRPVPPAPCEQGCGFITVNLTGRAMPVYIDNVPVGRTPLISYKVKAGPHRIRVRVGYRMVNETVQIDSGATVVKSYDAAPR